MIPPEVRQRLVDAALAAAQRGMDEGGVPIGAVVASADGRVLAASSNLHVQTGDPTAHAEVSVVRAAAALGVDVRGCVLATTLQPCWMCAGMLDLLGIATVVVADDESWPDGALQWLEARPVEVVVHRDARCRQLLGEWIARGQPLWHPPEG